MNNDWRADEKRCGDKLKYFDDHPDRAMPEELDGWQRALRERQRLAGELGKLRTILRNKLETIVCTEGTDRGVIWLSSESPTHYDAANKCQTYDHENFSELGDALIAMHDLLKGQTP